MASTTIGIKDLPAYRSNMQSIGYVRIQNTQPGTVIFPQRRIRDGQRRRQGRNIRASAYGECIERYKFPRTDRQRVRQVMFEIALRERPHAPA